jgi:hypothetical protein
VVLTTCDGTESQQWVADLAAPALIQNGDTPGTCLSIVSRGEVWMGPLSGGDTACLLLNRFDTPESMECPFAAIGASNVSKAVNLWTGETHAATARGIRIVVPPHDVAFFRVSHP